MKIAYVITKSSWGGAAVYVYDLALEAKRRGHDPVVICGGQGELTKRLQKQGIEIISIEKLSRDVNLFDDYSVYVELKRILQNMQPDIVHLNSSKIGGIGALAAKGNTKKIIFTAHGWAFNEDRNFIWRLATYIVSWITALLVDTVITISRKEESDARSFLFLDPSHIEMIYIGAHISGYETKTDARLIIEGHTKLQTTENTIWLGSLGELHHNKGHRYGIDMASILKEQGKDFVYYIIGEGERRKELEEMIRSKGLEGNVALLGAIPNPTNGATLLSAFDVFIFPSTKEGLPYALLEAGAAGIPVIATQVGGIPEIIEHQKNGLTAPSKSGEALVHRLESIFYDERIRNDYVEAMKDTVATKFSPAEAHEKTFRLYEN